MSDLDTLRRLRRIDTHLDRLRTRESAGLYLPWTQRVLNPFPLASSGNAWGDLGQPAAITVLAFYVTVFVVTTNNGTNFWTINVISRPSGTTLASVATNAISANTGTRLSDTTLTQPSSTDAWIELVPTATLSPGAIYIFPALALTGV